MSLARLVVTAVLVEGRSKAVVARDYGVSRRWVHELVRRFEAEGETGLEPRSRRPRASPHRVSDALEQEIVELRKHLAEEGLDAGAHTIAVHLERRHGAAPAPSTIWRVLSRRGFVTPQPQKRPRSSFVRFCAEMPNERWQADITHWKLRRGAEVEILNALDDHSRFLVASDARVVFKAADVVASFHKAAAAHGHPASLLTDNGAVFTAAPRGGGRSAIELECDRLGITLHHSAPYTPRPAGRWSGSTRRSSAGSESNPRRGRSRGSRPSSTSSAPTTTRYDRTERSVVARRRRPTRRGRRRLPPGHRSRHTAASGATGSIEAAGSRFATTAGCTTSRWAAVTPGRGCSCSWPDSTSGS